MLVELSSFLLIGSLFSADTVYQMVVDKPRCL